MSSETQESTDICEPNICQICGYISYHDKEIHQLSHMTLIIPYLYLGSKLNSNNFYELKSVEVKTIINVAWEVINIQYDEFKYIKYDWDDIYDFDILLDLDKIVDQIHNEITNKNTVLIHCAQGVSRSASVVIAYLIKYNNMNYNEAYAYVKTLRSCIDPNTGFIEQLKKYSEYFMDS